ncbi:unnamed protein product [Blepharisma stoltei]|uniref:EH domain-containing protein n=1 Tax=Blepharisma stoltei TaxID=1481888 RepID=A0AAU9IC86_9CILI|nr:unnamed protein product [Blepharisma stoltei]
MSSQFQMSGAAANSKSSQSKLILSPLESNYFSQLFQNADQSGSGQIDGRSAVNFMRTSNLPVDILKQIWALSTPNKEPFLDAERFNIAVKLIAFAQNQKPISLQSLNEKCPLPRFEGIEIPKETAADDWEINENDRKIYKDAFKKLSGDKGFLNGMEARELLQRTQFAMPILKKLWGLCDPVKTGIMKEGQFMVAMQIIAKVRSKGIEVPESLSASLQRVLDSSQDASPSKSPPLSRESSLIDNNQPTNASLPKPQPKQSIKSVKFKEPDIDAEPVPVHEKTPKDYSEKPERPSYQSSSRRKEARPMNSNELEFVIDEKEEILRRQEDLLRSISDMLDLDRNELDLFKQKNKQLENKVKEHEDQIKKMQNELNKYKAKFDETWKKQKDDLKALQQENTYLKDKTSQLAEKKPSAPPQEYPVKKPEVKVESPVQARPNLPSQLYPSLQTPTNLPQQSFQTSAPSQSFAFQNQASPPSQPYPPLQANPEPVVQKPISQRGMNPFDFDTSVPVNTSMQPKQDFGGFSGSSQPFSKPRQEFGGSNDSSQLYSQPKQDFPQNPPSQSGFPQNPPPQSGFSLENTQPEPPKPNKKFDAFSFVSQPKPEAKIEQKIYDPPSFKQPGSQPSSSPFDFSPPNSKVPAQEFATSMVKPVEFENNQGFSFNFKAENNPPSKIEFSTFKQPTPQSTSFEIKPENIQFDPHFDKFNNQGFDFKNASISSSFQNDFFKTEATNKPKSSALDFDFD